jgi:hypothetical protein
MRPIGTEHTLPLKSPGIVVKENLLLRILHTRKVQYKFNHLWRMLEKYLSVFRKYLSVYREHGKSLLIMDQHETFFRILTFYKRWIGLSQKPFQSDVSLKSCQGFHAQSKEGYLR